MSERKLRFVCHWCGQDITAGPRVAAGWKPYHVRCYFAKKGWPWVEPRRVRKNARTGLAE